MLQGKQRAAGHVLSSDWQLLSGDPVAGEPSGGGAWWPLTPALTLLPSAISTC